MNSKNLIKVQAQRGFTLIELMITVAIVGILAAIALPAYQDYVYKARVSEAGALAAGAKHALHLAYHDGSLSATSGHTALGLPAAASMGGQYVASITVAGTSTSSGTIVAVMQGFNDSAMDGKKITWRMTCVFSASCRTEIDEAPSATTLARKYWPKS